MTGICVIVCECSIIYFDKEDLWWLIEQGKGKIRGLKMDEF